MYVKIHNCMSKLGVCVKSNSSSVAVRVILIVYDSGSLSLDIVMCVMSYSK
jgi:hypothetical protein